MKINFALALIILLFSHASYSYDGVDVSEEFRVEDAIACKLDVPAYTNFSISIAGEDGTAAKYGWRTVKSKSSFFNEYVLPSPIQIAGMSVDHVMFAGSGVVAVLDLADPTLLARAEGITNDADPTALYAELKLTPEQIKQIPISHAFKGARIVSSTTEAFPDSAFKMHYQVRHSISTSADYPGKTLYGCFYDGDVVDPDGK